MVLNLFGFYATLTDAKYYAANDLKQILTNSEAPLRAKLAKSKKWKYILATTLRLRGILVESPCSTETF